MGSKLLFRFESGTNGLKKELRRHSTKNSSKSFYYFCKCECESVEQVLWECSEYSSIHRELISNLDGILQMTFY